MTALADLLAAVEADAAQADDFYDTLKGGGNRAHWAYDEDDLNDAFAFCRDYLDMPRIEIFGPTDDGDFGVTIGSQDTVFHAAPARALLIATLRALVEKEKQG